MNPNNFNYNQNFIQRIPNNYNDDRFVGGFAFPFLLGGVTGAAIAPAFFGGYNRPYYGRPYYNTNNYYYPYPYNPGYYYR